MYLKLASRNIWRNPRRTWITVASICLAVLLAFVMSSMQYGTYEQMINNTAKMYTGHLQVHGDGYWESRSINESIAYTDSLMAMLSTDNMPSVKVATPRVESFALASSGPLTKGAMVMGIDPDKEKNLLNPEKHLDTGHFFQSKSGKKAVLAQGLAENLNLSVGDTVVLIGQGYHGVMASGKYPVQGIVDLPSPDINKQALFLPLKVAQHMFGAYNRVTSISILVNDQEQVNNTVSTLKQQLGEKFDVMSWREMNPELLQAIEVDRASGMVMLLILYLVIGFGILGTVIMMTQERMYEFGMMMSIGMKPFKIIFTVILEIIFMTIGALGLGFLLSMPILGYLYNNPVELTGNAAKMMEDFGMEPVIPFSLAPQVFTEQIWIVLVISLLTAFYPIYIISKMKAIEAIRN